MKKILVLTIVAVLPAVLIVSCCRKAKDVPVKPYGLKVERIDDIGLRAENISRIALECGVPADSWLRLKADVYENHALREEKGISFGIGYKEGQKVNALLDLTSADYLSRLGLKEARNKYLVTFATDDSTTGPFLIGLPPSMFSVNEGGLAMKDGEPFVFAVHQAAGKDGSTIGRDFSEPFIEKIVSQSPHVIVWKIEVAGKEKN